MTIPSKKILIPMALVAIIGAGAYGVSQVSAASGTTSGQSLVDRIASTFGLDKSKVQAVFDQYKSDKQQQRETNYEQRLTQAVTDGKLTSAQKDKILAEHNHLASELQAALSKTGADRRTALQQIRSEAQAWATANTISEKWLMGFGPMHLRGGMGMGMGMGEPDTDDSVNPTPSPSSSSSSTQAQ